MTEKKLPKVGKKYRYIMGKEEVCVLDIYDNWALIKSHLGRAKVYCKEFFDCFEEIPDNLQPKESKPNAVEEAKLELARNITKRNQSTLRDA